MRTFAVLVTQPFDCFLDLDGALPFSENHLAGVAPDAKIKALAAHRAKLGAHQPLYDHGRFLASILTLLLGHRARCRGYGRPRSVMRLARPALQLLVLFGRCPPEVAAVSLPIFRSGASSQHSNYKLICVGLRLGLLTSGPPYAGRCASALAAQDL
jgi:hypothetical protein